MMRLALARVNVTGPDGTAWEKVTVQTRGDRLRISARTGGLLREVEASAVRVIGRRVWEVDTAEGVYKVERASGCGCG